MAATTRAPVSIDASAGAADPDLVLVKLLVLLLGALRSAFRGRSDLVLENLALRQQLAAFASSGKRPRVTAADRWFWVALRRLWSRWSDILVFVKPETVIRWHRAGFRLYWTWLSRRRRPGRPTISPAIRDLIRRMAAQNQWGAPRIHGELRMLGLDVSERTVSRYLPRRRRRRMPSGVGSCSSATTARPSRRWTSSSC